MKKIIYITFMFFSIFTFGQEIVVNGKVKDRKTGEPIPGATIIIDRTNKETQTDFDGKYSIIAKSNDTLVFSFFGMKTQKIRVDKEEINVELSESETLKESVGPPIRPKKSSNYPVNTVTLKEIQQEKKVAGKIFKKETNELIAGVIIKNKKTGKKTFSNVDGKFEIAASVNDILEIHFTGLSDIEIKVTDKSYYKIYLEEYVRTKTRKQIRKEKRKLRKKGFIEFAD